MRLTLPITNDHYGFRFAQRDTLGRFHPGVDLNGPGGGDADEGMEVACMAPGRVTAVLTGYNGGWGNLVYVKHDMDAIFAGIGIPRPDDIPSVVFSQYAHLKDESIKVSVGGSVETGTIIGAVGKTGGQASSHLHFEVRKQALGVFYYPPKTLLVGEFHERYFNPEEFIDRINGLAKKAEEGRTKKVDTDALGEAKLRMQEAEKRAKVAEGKLDKIQRILTS